MSPKLSRQQEDIELYKLVGAVLENTTRKPRRRLPWLSPFSSRRVRRLALRLRILLRRHPLVPVTLLICCVVWVCVANVSRSSSDEAADKPVRVDRRERLRAAPLATSAPEAARQGVSEEVLRATRSLGYWLQRLQSPDWKARSEAAFELVEKSRSSKLVLSVLHVVLSDSHAGVRFWAVDRFRVLRMYGKEVAAAMRDFAGNEELLALYNGSAGRTRQVFNEIIGSWLTDLDDDVRWAGLTICWMLGSGAGAFEPTLETIAHTDEHVRYRKQARAILGSLPSF